jgi:hypothetical protein
MWLEPGNFLEGKKAARECRSSSGEMVEACVALQCYFLNFYEKLFEMQLRGCLNGRCLMFFLSKKYVFIVFSGVVYA